MSVCLSLSSPHRSKKTKIYFSTAPNSWQLKRQLDQEEKEEKDEDDEDEDS